MTPAQLVIRLTHYAVAYGDMGRPEDKAQMDAYEAKVLAALGAPKKPPQRSDDTWCEQCKALVRRCPHLF